MKEPSRSQAGIECGIEWPIAYETSILEAGIDFSSRIRAHSLFLSESFRRKLFLGGINSMAKSIPHEESMSRNR